MSNINLRIISGAVLVFLAYCMIYVFIDIQPYVLALLSLIMIVELALILKSSPHPFYIRIPVLLAGSVYICLGSMGFSFIGANYDWHGQLAILALVATSDIGAYFTGRTIGGPKLAPHISPNKTWSGAIGGFASCLTLGLILTLKSTPTSDQTIYLLVVFAILAQLGDLLESWVKRFGGAKDSGNWIPGHGGLLDRADSLLAPLSVYALWVLWQQYL